MGGPAGGKRPWWGTEAQKSGNREDSATGSWGQEDQTGVAARNSIIKGAGVDPKMNDSMVDHCPREAYGKACQVLEGQPPVEVTEEVKEGMRKKHPPARGRLSQG